MNIGKNPFSFPCDSVSCGKELVARISFRIG
jgi:hypothetical protein